MGRHARIKSHLLPALIVVVAAVKFVGCMESTSHYSCCNPEIRFDQDCQHTWSINNMNIAHSDDESKECIHPCKAIESGVMTLHECAAVAATVVCTDEMNMISEKKIHYYPQPCSGSVPARGYQGSVELLLLAVMLAVMKVFIEL